MINFLFECIEKITGQLLSETEKSEMSEGVERFLLDNGVERNETADFYNRYINRILSSVKPKDLKNYLAYFVTISDVRDICIAYEAGTETDGSKRCRLKNLMDTLNKCGLKERYIPSEYVYMILG